VSGTAEPLELTLVSPLQSAPCLYYRARVRESNDGDGRDAFAEERAVGFRVRDPSGAVRVFPRGARFDVPNCFDESIGVWGGDPPGLLPRTGSAFGPGPDRDSQIAALLTVRDPGRDPWHRSTTPAGPIVLGFNANRLPPPPPPPPPPAAPASSESGAAVASHFRGLSREQIVAVIDKAADAHRIDLYLQPVVTLPQRKVRYYEALSRLRTEDGDIVPAGEFIDIAESAGLMPRIDNLLLFRCVQVTRRLQLKNRDIGVFCNVCGLTLSDPVYFRHFLDFMDANRALSGALILEFTQKAYRAFGPIEHESLAALAERGFRFSMDHVADLRMEPKELADRWFRFLKVPAALLLNPAFAAKSDIHQGDLADLLARSGIDLIAERVETESNVVDLLDFDVRFGQGFLFSPPRPVRPESLQGTPAATQAAGELAATGTG